MAKKKTKKKKGKKKQSTGSSGSKKDKDVKEIVAELSEEGKRPAEIGMVLRDTYGVGDIKEETGKKLTEILEEEDLASDIPADLQDLVDRAESIKEHLDTHDKDMEAKYGLQTIESRIRKLAKYYKKKEKLSSDWKY